MQQQHATRIEHLEACQKETTEQQESTLVRLQALEKVVADLDRGARSPTPHRLAPTTPRGGNGGNSPRSPRGSNDFGANYRDPLQDLGLVIGGWVDARSAEAEEEVRSMFRAAGLESRLASLSGPSGRTNFMRASLNFPADASISVKRQAQKEVLDKLKLLKCTSGIEGQSGAQLWIQKDRSLEERLRIRALVLTNNFYSNLPPLAGRNPPQLRRLSGEDKSLSVRQECCGQWMMVRSRNPPTRLLRTAEEITPCGSCPARLSRKLQDGAKKLCSKHGWNMNRRQRP